MTDTRRLPGPNVDRWDWQLWGSCRGLDSAYFFHPDNERGADRAARVARAKAICERCPVLEQCRRHALAVREPYGIWGGLTEHEREQLLRTSSRRLRTGESRRISGRQPDEEGTSGRLEEPPARRRRAGGSS